MLNPVVVVHQRTALFMTLENAGHSLSLFSAAFNFKAGGCCCSPASLLSCPAAAKGHQACVGCRSATEAHITGLLS